MLSEPGTVLCDVSPPATFRRRPGGHERLAPMHLAAILGGAQKIGADTTAPECAQGRSAHPISRWISRLEEGKGFESSSTFNRGKDQDGSPAQARSSRC